MMVARTMGTTPAKRLAVARVKPAHPVRTIATELPQELSRLPLSGGFFGECSVPSAVESAAPRRGRTKAARPQVGTAPTVRPRAALTTPGFTDEGHPTILAAPDGSSPPG